MAKTKKAPAADEVYEHAKELVQQNSKRDALFDRLDKLYDHAQNETAPGAEATVQLVHMPYASNAVDLVADLASQMELTIEVPANAETKKAQQIADDQEQWMRALMQNNDRIARRNSIGEAAWCSAQRGHCVTRSLFTDSLVERDGSGYKVASVPVLLQVRDPRYVYAEESATGVGCVVEACKRTAGSIRRTFPDALQDEKEYPNTAIVEWVEYWDETHRVYFADGDPIGIGKTKKAVVPHGFGCVPYSFGVARTTPRQAPELHYRPLLSAVEDTLHNIDTWFSILSTAGWAAVTNAWGVFSDTYGKDAGKQLDITPGAINYFARNDQVQPIQRAALPGDFFQLGTMLLQAFQHGTFPFALFGEMPGDMAGYAISLMTQSGRRPLLPIWHAIETCFEDAFRNAALISRNKLAPLVGDEIPLMITAANVGKEMRKNRALRRELKLDTRAVGDDFSVNVKLSDPMPSDEAANLKSAIESTGAGLLSKETALEKYNITQDAQAELERIQVQKMYEQLAPVEALRLAIERGYITQIEMPAGYHFNPDGTIVPDAVTPEQPQEAPQMEQQPMPNEVLQPAMDAPNAADLQSLFGQPNSPTLDQMAGTPPTVPQQGGLL